jgi:hypothetical protein
LHLAYPLVVLLVADVGGVPLVIQPVALYHLPSPHASVVRKSSPHAAPGPARVAEPSKLPSYSPYRRWTVPAGTSSYDVGGFLSTTNDGFDYS